MKPIALFAALVVLSAGGCASWDASKWDLSRYRDPRASDLDKRLSVEGDHFANPFGASDAKGR